MMMIDSHHHLWTYNEMDFGWIDESMSKIRRDFGMDELAAVARENQVESFVSVQARQSLDETKMLLDFASKTELISGVVGWFPLIDPDIDEILSSYEGQRFLKGARHVLHDEADPTYCLTAEFHNGIRALTKRGLVYDLLVFPQHLPHIIELVDDHPDQVFVLDHLAKPCICASTFDASWAASIRELARRPHVACKVSGVFTEVRDPDWDLALLRPYFETILEAFSPGRLLYGSDWPVCLLREDYTTWLETAKSLVADLAPAEQDAFFSRNASKVYQL